MLPKATWPAASKSEAPVKEVVVEALPAEVVVERVVPETERVVTKRRKGRRHKSAA